MSKNDDSVAAVLDDYQKIAQNHDWAKEQELGRKAVGEYIETIRDLIEAKRYSRQAVVMIESLMEEVESYKLTIVEQEVIIGELNALIEALMQQLNALTDEDNEEGTPTE
jgi:hypothetical protein